MLGIPHRDNTISCISLADDAVLLSNNIYDLNNLLFLTIQYCEKYKVELVPSKTKLVAFCKNDDEHIVRHSKLISPISLYGKAIAFSDTAEHLGILRSSSPGNIPNILERLSAHKKKLFSVLPAGMAMHHHANPAASLRAEHLYAVPVLLSGLAALVLSKYEMDLVSSYHKKTLTRLMKLHDRTPDSAVFFLAGSLPVSAHLHLRQLSLFSMICQLEGNILKSVALSSLVEARPSSKSWFTEVRDISIQYDLPHPIKLLQSPISKIKYKILCKQKIHEYWHQKLSQESNLPSLQYLHSSHFSLLLLLFTC